MQLADHSLQQATQHPADVPVETVYSSEQMGRIVGTVVARALVGRVPNSASRMSLLRSGAKVRA